MQDFRITVITAETISKIRTTDKISIINVVTASITTIIKREIVVIKETLALRIVAETIVCNNNGMTKLMVSRINVVASKMCACARTSFGHSTRNYCESYTTRNDKTLTGKLT